MSLHTYQNDHTKQNDKTKIWQGCRETEWVKVLLVGGRNGGVIKQTMQLLYDLQFHS